ncbi:S24 family peptidase [Qipengyuania marisflavi]|uniref:S24 family peptidase n=1 Tax=Qipengyuania marisflavi TaxID=2486356 RepID=A0A5S3PAD8_9SPHN|nr:S24 family peptidase [Qipengyuania marisflavi]TMM50333.1 S24 family peptidase [Qipengyuania marisflavi]
MENISLSERHARGRLQDLARDSRTSLAELSRLIGRNAAYLQQYVRRGSPRHLDEPDLRKIAEFLGVKPRLIATRTFDDAPHNDTHTAPGEWVEVPRLPLDASAGPGAMGAEEISFDAFRFSRRWLREMGLEGADLSAIRVEGDSMDPLLRSGDEIFVDRNKRAGEGIHVVRIGDALHVKQVQASAPGRIALISANDGYAPIELGREEVEIIGRVVWKGGRV